MAAQQTGTGFTNLQQYLNSNRNNNLAGQIGTGLQNDVNTLNKQFTGAAQDFSKQAAAGNMATDANKQAVQNIYNKAQNDPNSLSEADVSQYRNLANATYSGPNSFQDYNKYQGQAQGLQNLGNAAKSQYGRYGLLQRYIGGPQYTQGQQALDNVLLGQSQNNPALNSAVRASKGVGNQISGQSRALNELAKGYVNQNRAFAQQNQQQADTGVKNLSDILSQRVTDDQAAQDAAYKELLRDKSSDPYNANDPQIQVNVAPGSGMSNYVRTFRNQGDINNMAGVTDPAMLQRLGVSLGFDRLNNYISRPQINTSTVSSPEEAARLKAFASLAGQMNTLDPAQIGQYTKPLQLDQQGLINSLKNDLQSQLSRINNQGSARDNKTAIDAANSYNYVLGNPLMTTAPAATFGGGVVGTPKQPSIVDQLLSIFK